MVLILASEYLYMGSEAILVGFYTSVPYKADLVQGKWLSELLDHIEPSALYPRHTDAVHTVPFRNFGFAGLLEF